MSRTEEVHWRRRPVTVEFGHLNPALQAIIGKSAFDDFCLTLDKKKLKALRFNRGLGELSLLAGIGFLSGCPGPKLPSDNLHGVTAALAGSSLRTWAAKLVQKRYIGLIKSMNQSGILQTKFEGNYPRDWINPTIIANSHPVFYVNAKGDMVFLRNNRWEYARYVFQKSFAGKIGLNLWRWRGYLEPPKAPQPVREWAKEKALEWAGALVPKRKPAFGMVRAATAARVRRKKII